MSNTDPVRANVEWTYADYRLMPDDGLRYEVIDGDLLVTPAPSISHQRASKRIQTELILQIEHRGKGVVYNAPVDVIFSDRRTVQPDLLVVRAERTSIISERGVEGAPDLIVEILSPSTEKTDREIKRKLYASEGVGEYWLVDPAARTVEVLTLTRSGYDLRDRFGPTDQVESGLFEVNLAIDAIFAP